MERRRSVGLILVAAGLVLGAIALVLAVSAPAPEAGDPAAVEASLRPTVEPFSPSTEPPDTTAETAPHTSALWQANQDARSGEAPDQAPLPIRLRIEAIGVDAPIEAVGVDPRTGEMALPATVREVAWYRFGPSPGQAGSAVLAAHVDFKDQGPGVFFDLKTLEPGDRIEVSFEDGDVERFRVAARDIYRKDELPLDAVFARQGAPVLTLITCGGGFNPSIGHYDSNVVVYALPDGVADPGGVPG